MAMTLGRKGGKQVDGYVCRSKREDRGGGNEDEEKDTRCRNRRGDTRG